MTSNSSIFLILAENLQQQKSILKGPAAHRLGNTALSDTTRHILNVSNYVLSDTKDFVLSHGLNFELPPRYLGKGEIFAEFESLWEQLLHHSASSVEQRTALKARLAALLICTVTAR